MSERFTETLRARASLAGRMPWGIASSIVQRADEKSENRHASSRSAKSGEKHGSIKCKRSQAQM